MSISSAGIVMKVLANGLVFLGLRVSEVSTVSLQLFYNVGSKHEQSGERGLAHLLEHMIFKGTKDHAEGYINQVAQALSASLNADTSYDRTRYFFNAPKEHWEPFLAILADCMNNCTFMQECLNSEMKAVIQELKMYKDYHTTVLFQQMMGSLFSDHPYHYPIIGFKQDLWNITRERLTNFYKKHYIPNNAVLVVVGDVDIDQVYQKVEQLFGEIPANPDYTQEERYHSTDIVQQTTKLYRDVHQSSFMYIFTMNKADLQQEVEATILSSVLTNGKTGRLYKRLVEDKMIASSVQSFYHGLYDHGIFAIVVTPKDTANLETIHLSIQKEITDVLQTICSHGLSDHELQRITPSIRSEVLSSLQSPHQQATVIGTGFLKTGNPSYLFDYLNYPLATIAQDIQTLVKHSFRPSLMHAGLLLPLNADELPFWKNIQETSDQEDTKILSKVTRPVEEHKQKEKNNSFDVPQIGKFIMPNIKTTILNNGATLFRLEKTVVPKIMVTIRCKACSWYEPIGKEGLSNFIELMLCEGTKNFPGTQLAEHLESKGMRLSINSYTISLDMLKEDFKEGLMLLNELCTNACLPSQSLERIRAQLQTNVQHFQDNPTALAVHIANKTIYAGTPFAYNRIGSKESIAAINLEDIKKAYKDFIVPDKARIVVVGDIAEYDVVKEVQDAFVSWKGNAPQRPDINPIGIPTLPKEIIHQINRDQIVLSFCTSSVTLHDKKYSSLLLFDQILGSGLLGSMNNRLFALREQSGLFYTISGSLTKASGDYTGMMYVTTIVSLDRLEEARKVITRVLDATTLTITPEELKQATNAVLRFYTKAFDTLSSAASTILFFDKFGLEHVQSLLNNLKTISSQQVTDDVKNILSQPRTTIFVGRV